MNPDSYRLSLSFKESSLLHPLILLAVKLVGYLPNEDGERERERERERARQQKVLLHPRVEQASPREKMGPLLEVLELHSRLLLRKDYSRHKRKWMR
ncbi:unnamed protein product [Timema podura]|uniref:Uncharacterized protein n=1 Tax=Timema podura TaxID=61482 RepID=A0ABN7NIK9_TIMPD|nr:unnamed protein product [Timema podura]